MIKKPLCMFCHNNCGMLAEVEGGKAVRLPTQTPADKRNKWIYDECCKGTDYESTIRKLRKKPKSWERLEWPQSVRAAAIRFADKHGLPHPPKRQHGRPKTSKN